MKDEVSCLSQERLAKKMNNFHVYGENASWHGLWVGEPPTMGSLEDCEEAWAFSSRAAIRTHQRLSGSRPLPPMEPAPHLDIPVFLRRCWPDKQRADRTHGTSGRCARIPHPEQEPAQAADTWPTDPKHLCHVSPPQTHSLQPSVSSRTILSWKREKKLVLIKCEQGRILKWWSWISFRISDCQK